MVVALPFEAQCLGVLLRGTGDLSHLADGTLVRISGMGGERAAQAARHLIAAGAGALLSWGVAGALDPSLRSGMVVLPTAVARCAGGAASGPTEQFSTSSIWRERVAAALLRHVPTAGGTLWTAAAPVTEIERKASLFQATGAVAVDMESAAVAELAEVYGLPFLAVRVIVDTAHDAVPERILRALNPEAPAWGRLRASWPLLAHPPDWIRLLKLAWGYRRARGGLRTCARWGEPTRLGDGAGVH